jgi:hypothetical protein
VPSPTGAKGWPSDLAHSHPARVRRRNPVGVAYIVNWPNDFAQWVAIAVLFIGLFLGWNRP